MTTSPTTLLSKPEGDTKLRRPTLAYVMKRGRQQAYNLIVSEFKKSGISQATLARRLGKGTDQVSRLLRRPSNIEIDTLAAVLFALTGGLVTYDQVCPSQGSDLKFEEAGKTGTDEQTSYIEELRAA